MRAYGFLLTRGRCGDLGVDHLERVTYATVLLSLGPSVDESSEHTMCHLRLLTLLMCLSATSCLCLSFIVSY